MIAKSYAVKDKELNLVTLCLALQHLICSALNVSMPNCNGLDEAYKIPHPKRNFSNLSNRFVEPLLIGPVLSEFAQRTMDEASSECAK